MKFWFEVELEDQDVSQECFKCGKSIAPPDHLFMEHELRDNRGDLHPEPTGNFMCADCGKKSLV
jgi:hypothetical protein